MGDMPRTKYLLFLLTIWVISTLTMIGIRHFFGPIIPNLIMAIVVIWAAVVAIRRLTGR